MEVSQTLICQEPWFYTTGHCAEHLRFQSSKMVQEQREGRLGYMEWGEGRGEMEKNRIESIPQLGKSTCHFDMFDNCLQFGSLYASVYMQCINLRTQILFPFHKEFKKVKQL